MSKKNNKKKKNKNSLKRKILALGILVAIVALVVWLVVYGPSVLGKKKYDKNYKYDGVSLIGIWTDSSLDQSSYDVYNFVDNDTVILTTNCFGIELQRLEASYEVTDKNQLIATYSYKDNLGNDKTQRDYFRFSINKKGELVLVVLNDLNNAESERVMKKHSSLGYNEGENKLVGTWEYIGLEGVIRYTFDDDFTGKMYTEENGEIRECKIYYSYKDGKLYYIREYGVSLQEQVRASDFSVSEGTLTLGSGESSLEFTKK